MKSNSLQFRPLCKKLARLFNLLVVIVIYSYFECRFATASLSTDKVGVSSIGDKDKLGFEIVGYGEDCSLDVKEGLVCDSKQHLTCDPIEEICVCDMVKGYVHISDLPGQTDTFQYLDDESDGTSVCVSIKKIEERMENMLMLDNAGSKFNANPEEDQLTFDVKDLDEEVEVITSPEPNKDVYEKFMKELEENGHVNINSDFDEERLQNFASKKIPLSNLSLQTLILLEILKYDNPSANLKTWTNIITVLIEENTQWTKRKLTNSICRRAFDVDHDGIFSYEDYVILVLSKIIPSITMNKSFLSLIGPLAEHKCISIEDLSALEHSPNTLQEDFKHLDSNNDGCFSYEEFIVTVHDVCRINWLNEFLTDVGLVDIVKHLDPSPEEMYVRKLTQNTRLENNWKIIDSDQDGFLSYEELQADLLTNGYESDDFEEDEQYISEAYLIINHIDKNNDGKISLSEVKRQIVLPDFNKEYQFDWLESLYELYETDEVDVEDYLNYLTKSYTEMMKHVQDKYAHVEKEQIIEQLQPDDRIFSIFDKNRNKELDQVEFRLLLEIMKKYVLHTVLNTTLGAFDSDSDNKITVFEYEEFYLSATPALQIYFKNLLAMEEGEEQDDSIIDQNEEHDQEYEEEDEEEYEDGERNSVSAAKLSKKAMAVNDTRMIHKLFNRLDKNADGILTKEDFHTHLSLYNGKKTDEEIKEEFSSLDINKDGIVSKEDSEDFKDDGYTLQDFKNANELFTEEIRHSDLVTHFSEMDINQNSVVEPFEYKLAKHSLFTSDEDLEFIIWLEHYFGYTPEHKDPGGEKVFREFDSNCDGYITQAEFELKVEDLYRKSKLLRMHLIRLKGEPELYFNCLDLTKDGRVSYNEFEFLLLRNGQKIHED